MKLLQAGGDAVQIFDSWAGVLPAQEFHQGWIEPIQRIIAKVRQQVGDAKVIGFSRGAGPTLLGYVKDTSSLQHRWATVVIPRCCSPLSISSRCISSARRKCRPRKHPRRRARKSLDLSRLERTQRPTRFARRK